MFAREQSLALGSLQTWPCVYKFFYKYSLQEHPIQESVDKLEVDSFTPLEYEHRDCLVDIHSTLPGPLSLLRALQIVLQDIEFSQSSPR